MTTEEQGNSPYEGSLEDVILKEEDLEGLSIYELLGFFEKAVKSVALAGENIPRRLYENLQKLRHAIIKRLTGL